MTNQAVELHVDPICPWCWLTVLWLFEAERVRPITVTTRLLSLAEVNRDKPDYAEGLAPAERAERVLVAARRAGGEAGLRATYLALGDAHHERGEALADLATLRAALTAAGLDPALASQALDDPTTLSELLAEHAQAADRGAFGVPTLSVDGSAPFFGPIVQDRVSGAEAGRLWDVVAPVLTEPLLFEIKRNRTGRPHIGRLRARAAATPDGSTAPAGG